MSLTFLFLIYSAQYDLPANLLESLCYVESKHKTNAVHKHDGNGNSIGICQIKLKTAQHMGFKGTEKQLLDPKINIEYAAKYLSHQIKRYNGSIKKGVIAYNMGSARNLTSSKYQYNVYKQWRENEKVRINVKCY